MSTLNYLVKGKKNYSNILIRFKNGRKFDYTSSTELKVDPKNWSKAKQKVKNTSGDKTKDAINNHLLDLKKHIFDNFNLDNSTGIYIDKQWLEKQIATYFKRPMNETVLEEVYFLPFISNFIKEAPTRIIKSTNKPVSAGTITKYKSTEKKLIAYEKHYKTKIKFSDLNLNFHKQFMYYLMEVEKIGINTTGKFIKNVKSFAREALLLGLPVHNEINHPNLFAPVEETTDIYLKNERDLRKKRKKKKYSKHWGKVSF